MQFVTTAEAKDQVRSDNDADDAWFALWIPAISQAVASWLKDDWRPYVPALDTNGDVLVDSSGDPIPAEDSNGDLIVQPMVKAATLVELAQQYRHRDGKDARTVESHWGHGYVLGQGATSLLVALRKSTVA